MRKWIPICICNSLPPYDLVKLSAVGIQVKQQQQKHKQKTKQNKTQTRQCHIYTKIQAVWTPMSEGHITFPYMLQVKISICNCCTSQSCLHWNALWLNWCKIIRSLRQQLIHVLVTFEGLDCISKTLIESPFRRLSEWISIDWKMKYWHFFFFLGLFDIVMWHKN